MRILMVVAMVGVLAGCADNVRMPELSQYQADFAPWSSSELVDSVRFEKAGPPGDLPRCIAETVSNQGETLSDSSGSFVGAYTGNYYNVERGTHVGGGSVIEYAAPDGRLVVASGSTRYAVNSLVSRSVRFKLSVRQADAGRQYQYGSLAQAQLDSGAVANTGYNPIGAWAGANPDLALKALQGVTDEIESCLAR